MESGLVDGLLAPFQTGTFQTTVHILVALSPVWVPTVLTIFAYQLWMRYVRMSYMMKRDKILLEIRLPAEVTKSPLAMEVFLTALYQTGSPQNLFDTYLRGQVPPWFSLELVSLEGEIHFYIWAFARYKNLIEAQLYAQYPQAEIFEVEDYARNVEHSTPGLSMWGTYFVLTKPDPYPIKTYVDYKLDEETKEEFKIDPMTSTLEYLASLGKGEQAWIQILIQSNTPRGFKYGFLRKTKDWRKEAKAEIERIRQEATPKMEGSQFPGFPNPTRGQIATIAAIERSMSKFSFDCMIRAFYIWENEHFQSVAIPALIGSLRQFSDNDLNGFKLGWFTDTDQYPWQDFRRIRRNAMERGMLNAYKRRSFFQYPYKHFHAKSYIMTTEELATIFHLPGTVAQTPTLPRAQYKRAEAPSNLPR